MLTFLRKILHIKRKLNVTPIDKSIRGGVYWELKLQTNVKLTTYTEYDKDTFNEINDWVCDYIHFKSDNYKGKQYRIINTIGQTILNGNIKDDLTKIDVRNLQRGSYYLHIENNPQQVKLIIQ